MNGVLVVVNGYAGSGKDTIGRILADELGFEIAKVSQPLKRAVHLYDPILGHRIAWRGLRPRIVSVRASDLMDDPDDDAQQRRAKDHPRYGRELRVQQQRMGTEVPDGVLGTDVWARALMARIGPSLAAGGRVVVTDGRRVCEADAARSAGGVIVRVERPGCGPANAHPNEVEMDGYGFDAVIRNDGSFETLRARTLDVVAGLLAPADGAWSRVAA